ncbi:DUF5403 family protein [Gordonia sp. X0973]|uniref:DUF5403 family protein n=1 Tax=Gordonia sp. X0973 TaxID=2742602 RepID=UPI000F5247EA|nr:DUF5403 family protein [Gordonia sp. X0973]QKT07934.1 DUF5403 family protein [Gordonia sp. X0973]
MNGQKVVNHIVSHVEGVKRAVHHEAEDVADLADAIADTYRDPTDGKETRISVTKGDVDSFVNLEHPAVIPREFGWEYVNPNTGERKWVEGKYTLQRAAMTRGGYG